MSLKKFIITALLLGTSTIAAADPAPPAFSWLRHTVEAPKPPTMLASSTRVNGRDTIKVNDYLRAFNKLELRARSGRTDLDKVVITFGNGKTQTINCNRVLQNNQSFTIDLKGDQRNLKKVVLVGKSGRRASLDVLAL